mmetsp:Transcript_73514/g.172437  ORF Transcript_73514/g.172437 Transcript_73514/m.172437 type:complete len:200 (+) Transcript_73514:697-1296(+)
MHLLVRHDISCPSLVFRWPQIFHSAMSCAKSLVERLALPFWHDGSFRSVAPRHRATPRHAGKAAGWRQGWQPAGIHPPDLLVLLLGLLRRVPRAPEPRCPAGCEPAGVHVLRRRQPYFGPRVWPLARRRGRPAQHIHYYVPAGGCGNGGRDHLVCRSTNSVPASVRRPGQPAICGRQVHTLHWRCSHFADCGDSLHDHF